MLASDTPLRELMLTLTMSAGSGPTVPFEDDSGTNMGEVLLARYGYGIVDWFRAQGAWSAEILEQQLKREGFERQVLDLNVRR